MIGQTENVGEIGQGAHRLRAVQHDEVILKPVQPREEDHARNIVTFRNPVDVVEPAGSDTFVTTTLGGKDAISRMRADTRLTPGQTCDFAVNMDKAVLFDPRTEQRVRLT